MARFPTQKGAGACLAWSATISSRRRARLHVERSVVNRRVANKQEFEAGEVIFYMPEGQSRPYTFARELPVPAVIVAGDLAPLGTALMNVQAEEDTSGNVVLGVTWDDTEGICSLEEVRLNGD